MDDAELLDELEALDDCNLTDWELDFIESLAGWVEDGLQLTDRQREVAEDLLERRG